MGLFDHFPYTNVHELNLDWILSMMKALEAEWEAFTAGNSLQFADPMLHDVTKTYAKNTIVLDANGNAYVSLQAVPIGVGLQNGDYWLMVFDYEAFIEKVNKNFTARYYRGSYRANAAMAIGDWLTIDDVLYKATAAIAVDDVLEDGVNITHFTLEDFIKAFMQSANQLIQQYKDDIDASELLYRQQLAQDIADTTATLSAQLAAAIAGVTVDSEVIDARVGANDVTYATLGTAIRTQFDFASQYHDNNKHNIETILGMHDDFYLDYERGSITGSDGQDEAVIYAARSFYYNFPLPVDIKPTTAAGYTYVYYIYNLDKSYVEYHTLRTTVHLNDPTKLYRFRITSSDTANPIDIDYAKTLIQYNLTSNFKSIPELASDSATKENIKVIDQNISTILGYVTDNKFNFYWEDGAIALSTGLNTDAAWAIRTPDLIKFTKPTIIHFDYDHDVYRSQYIVYDSNGDYVEYHNKQGDFIITGSDLDNYYRIRIAMADTTQPIDYDIAKNFVTYTPQIFASIPELISSVISSNKPLYGKTVVCFGDSITGNAVDPYGYPYKLALETGATVINAGFGGTNMAAVDTRAALSMSSLADAISSGDWSTQTGAGISINSTKPNATNTAWQSTGVDYVPDRLTALQAIDWNDVDYITMFFGTNDWNDRVVLDNINNKYDTTTFKGAFRNAVEQIWSANPKIKILPITPMWRWFTASTDSDNTPKSNGGMYLYEYATALQEVAREYHLHVTDMYYENGFGRYNESAYFYSNDGTHPNPYGQSCLSLKICNELSYNMTR